LALPPLRTHTLMPPSTDTKFLVCDANARRFSAYSMSVM